MWYRTDYKENSVKFSDSTLREELRRLGFNAGPIVDSTRSLYVKKLATLKRKSKSEYGGSFSGVTEPAYKPLKAKQQQRKICKAPRFNIQDCLSGADLTQDLKPYIQLEEKGRAYFGDPRNNSTNNTTKKSFTYLFLDPRITKNLSDETKTQNITKNQNINRQWETFINSIFYVGKGTNGRPYKHLEEALSLRKDKGYKTSKDEKIQRIFDIWDDDKGVICQHVFHNVIQDEAFTYEAAMIDALGINRLTNIKLGSYKGIVKSWREEEQLKLGVYLLYKALNNYLNKGERQLRPDDI
ncbi:unnamed protein product [Arctia plantaginis]|uniref:LEM domain-containing protein n=1 Tax=Arctia plantaginis TaxID=874455 RepID=A0A8S1B2L6_ARCPL|nr:unnamed protein product [Arctia plantaginis]